MALTIRSGRAAAIGLSVIVIVCVCFLGYRAVVHQQTVATLNKKLSETRRLNGRDRAMAVRLQATRADLKAQLFSALDMTDLHVNNASATASLMSNRLERLGKHVHDIDAVVLKARSLADRNDSVHIRRDTSIALNRRVRVSELVTAITAVFDDFRANPYAAMASDGSATEIGGQLGHSTYGLSKSLRIIADDFGTAIHRRNATASSLQSTLLHLKRAGPFSL
jgi:hypothetical protein